MKIWWNKWRLFMIVLVVQLQIMMLKKKKYLSAKSFCLSMEGNIAICSHVSCNLQVKTKIVISIFSHDHQIMKLKISVVRYLQKNPNVTQLYCSNESEDIVHEFHMWLADIAITFLASIFTRRSQSVESWCPYVAYKRWFLEARNILYLNSYICYFFNTLWLTDIKINSFFGESNMYLNICCCASLLKSSLPTQVLERMSLSSRS